MRVLVTGGAGFIGSHVVDALVGRGDEVVVVDDLSTGRAENLNAGARFYRLDIRDPALRATIAAERPEVVIHHAAQMDVRRSVREPQFDADVNIGGSLNLLEGAARGGVRKVVYASTGGAMYGNPRPDELPVAEDRPPCPVSHYGASKHAVEHYLHLYEHLYGLDYTTLRYPNVYGPRQNPFGEAGVVAIFAEQLLRGERPTIYGDGAKSRDYLDVADVVAANLAALATGPGAGSREVLNLGTGRETTDLEVFEAVRAATGRDVRPIFAPVRPGEVERIALDATRAATALGWTPRVGFAAGVRAVVDWIATARVPSRAAPPAP